MEFHLTMKSNNFLLAGFPLVASLCEATDATIEAAHHCTFHGVIVHIPSMVAFRLLITLLLYAAITFQQYQLADAIAHESGWCSHQINSIQEVVLLVYTMIT